MAERGQCGHPSMRGTILGCHCPAPCVAFVLKDPVHNNHSLVQWSSIDSEHWDVLRKGGINALSAQTLLGNVRAKKFCQVRLALQKVSTMRGDAARCLLFSFGRNYLGDNGRPHISWTATKEHRAAALSMARPDGSFVRIPSKEDK